jgi:hypothetical protein
LIHSVSFRQFSFCLMMSMHIIYRELEQRCRTVLLSRILLLWLIMIDLLKKRRKRERDW